MESYATDVESGTKTVPARDSVEVTDEVRMWHLDSDATYRLETKFIDLTTGEVVPVIGTTDKDCEVSDDGLWVTKEFVPAQQHYTTTSFDTQTLSATLDTSDLKGHTLMAVDYLYQRLDITKNNGYWNLVKIHPAIGEDSQYEEDDDQKLYVPDLHTKVEDILTGDREGARSTEDGLRDLVDYMNLSKSEEYVLGIQAVNTDTGEKIGEMQYTNLFFSRSDTPISGSELMDNYLFDSSQFGEGTSITVCAYLWRAERKDTRPDGGSDREP